MDSKEVGPESLMKFSRLSEQGCGFAKEVLDVNTGKKGIFSLSSLEFTPCVLYHR